MSDDPAEFLAVAAHSAISQDDHPEVFEDFQRLWRPIHVARRGDRHIALWASEAYPELYVVVTEGAAAVACGRLDIGEKIDLFREGLRWQDVFVTAFRAEPGADAIRFRRKDATADAAPEEVSVTEGYGVILDCDNGPAVRAFEAVRIEGQWVGVADASLPYTQRHIARAYGEHVTRYAETGEDRWTWWAYDVFHTLKGAAWEDAVFAVLHHADPKRDANTLGTFGALIYGQGHWFYDRLDREPINPETLELVLDLEKPEFLPPDVRQRYDAWARKVGVRGTY